jgi:alanyl-tRNA synthetase
MNAAVLRKKFLDFFAGQGHTIVPSSSLLPADPSVLFTTAGMQQFKRYFLGEKSPYGNRAVSCQKCFRTSDIEEVGDEDHLTFLEMLGHFSFGDYFKKETIGWTHELLTGVFEVNPDRISVTVFAGDETIPFDQESYDAWLQFLPQEKINRGLRQDNVWGPLGPEGPCGAANEVYVDNLEVATLVFMEYYCSKDKNLTLLSQKGVDVGWGLERLTMIIQGKSNVFETDLFLPVTAVIPGQNEKARRIIADHIKGAVFLISEGVLPLNIEQGYVLRRILRRAIRFGKLLALPRNFLIPLAQRTIEIYQTIYPKIKSRETDILTVIQKEGEKFEKTLNEGLKQFEKLSSEWGKEISGREAFRLFDTYGFPLELTEELAKEKGLKVDLKGFAEAFKKHRKISRAGAEVKFGGGGEFSPKLHTATHLLHAALRKVLGEHVKQMGSDINVQRLRFDFTHSQKIAESDLEKIEDLVNRKIKENLQVRKEEMKYQEALKSGALAFFKEKYPERVTVYSLNGFSREICAGPHIQRTGELGRFKIIKEEGSGAGIRRIRATLE